MEREIDTIEWHEKNIKNTEVYLERLGKELVDKEKQISRMKKDNQFYKMQVETAKKKKKERFDADRFLVKKRR